MFEEFQTFSQIDCMFKFLLREISVVVYLGEELFFDISFQIPKNLRNFSSAIRI